MLLSLAFYAKCLVIDHPRPIYIIVPAALIKQWAMEIDSMWTGLKLWLMYASTDVQPEYKDRIITRKHPQSLTQSLDDLTLNI